VKTAGQDIWDYDDDYDPNDPGDPAGTGDIQNYNVEYTDFVWLHVDLSGIAVDNDGHRTHYWARVAPYSHDADAHGGGSGDEPQTVAEPGGLPLFGLALWLFLLARRRWFASI
ncbi:MAG: hypothetical protein QF491_07555, partial [Alphaproteobacteria bacterium]|nr:hypothetical protein [Alphaproteobacteria bacterium]